MAELEVSVPLFAIVEPVLFAAFVAETERLEA